MPTGKRINNAPGRRSRTLHREALKRFPGGVNSPVRAFRAVGGEPVWIERGSQAELVDVDGRRYIDYVLSWGALILGHAEKKVVEAVRKAAQGGLGFGANHRLELELARQIQRVYPGIERMRLVNSGTEAVMSAVRLARAFTGREIVIKFAGGYHGHADLLLAEAGSGVATCGLPGSAGVPPAVVASTLTATYNDLASVEAVITHAPAPAAAIIVEPVAGNMGCVPPEPGFLEGLRQLATRHGALLIFDEVMTGFRIARGGGVERYGITPDLITLGKIMGGGLPAAAYGGRAEILGMVAPEGPVYQAGTLAGNPIAMAAGAATLERLREDRQFYSRLDRMTRQLAKGLKDAAAAAGATCQVQSACGMLTVFFQSRPVKNYEDAKSSDTGQFARFHAALLREGVYWPPSQFEAAFLSSAHGERELKKTLAAAAAAFAAARPPGDKKMTRSKSQHRRRKAQP